MTIIEKRDMTTDKFKKYYSKYIIDVSSLLIEEENLYGKFLWDKKFKCMNRVLDIGCGRSWFVRSRPDNCIGIDINDYIIKNYYNKENLKLIIADACHIPFKDGIFDGIYSEYLLEHLSEPERLFEEFYRLLNNRGYLYISVPHPNSLNHGFYDDYTHIRPYSFESLRMLAKAVGFSKMYVHHDLFKLGRASRTIFATPNLNRLFGYNIYYFYMNIIYNLPFKNKKFSILEAWKDE